MGEDGDANQTFTSDYRHYALGLIFLIAVLNYIDRQILSILLPAIKEDLDLSDTQLGFLTGSAFALFFSTVGIPIARWADSWNRKNIIAIAIAIWSVITAMSGLAQNFVQLALARVGVGIGEAGAGPSSHSLLADYFSSKERALALSIYALGIPVGFYSASLWVVG